MTTDNTDPRAPSTARTMTEPGGDPALPRRRAADPARASGEGTLGQVFRCRRFWVLFCGAMAIGVVSEGVSQTYLPHAATQGIDTRVAAAALGMESLAYIVGQVAGGALSDRYGRRSVGLVACLAIGVGVVMAFVAAGSTAGVAFVGLVVYGTGIGATIAIRSAVFGDVFAGPSFGAIFGVLAIAFPVGGILPIYLGSLSFDALGSYWPVFAAILVAAVAWAVALAIAGNRAPEPRREPGVAHVQGTD